MSHKAGSGRFSISVGSLSTTPLRLRIFIPTLAHASPCLAYAIIFLALAAAAALLAASTGQGGLTVMAEDSVICPQFRAEKTEEPSQGVKKFVLQESVPTAGSDECAENRSWHTLSFREVAGLWQRSSLFTEMFAASLAAVPFGAMFWESLPVTKATMVSVCSLPKRLLSYFKYVQVPYV